MTGEPIRPGLPVIEFIFRPQIVGSHDARIRAFVFFIVSRSFRVAARALIIRTRSRPTFRETD